MFFISFVNDTILLQMFKLIIFMVALTYFVNGDPDPKQKSMVKYVNPKYMGDVQITMFRRKRSDPYFTNITATTILGWANNVTFQVSYPVEDGTTFKMSSKMCDLANKVWVVEVFRLHSNITECPQAPGTYSFYNLAIMPKVLPSPVPTTKKGSSAIINMLFYITATKENIMEVQLLVKIR